MVTTRRAFIRQVGISLAALLASGCINPRTTATPPTPSCYAPTAPTLTPRVTDSRWRDLQACWLDLADPRMQSAAASDLAPKLQKRHQAALEALIAAGLVAADVAAEIGAAYEEAVAHLSAKQAMCYAVVLGAISPYSSREELILQAAALTEMAERSDIDPATVAKVQTTLERDIAWLAQFHAGKQPGDLGAIAASPAEIEAARILVDLLSERM